MREEMTITGDLRHGDVAEWASHRAARLSLHGHILQASDSAVTIAVSGPEVLLDAMALACSLGPAQALIDRVDRRSLDNA
ncbi:MAG: acylphosphatase [Qingshengfaniella sp.]